MIYGGGGVRRNIHIIEVKFQTVNEVTGAVHTYWEYFDDGQLPSGQDSRQSNFLMNSCPL